MTPDSVAIVNQPSGEQLAQIICEGEDLETFVRSHTHQVSGEVHRYKDVHPVRAFMKVSVPLLSLFLGIAIVLAGIAIDPDATKTWAVVSVWVGIFLAGGSGGLAFAMHDRVRQVERIDPVTYQPPVISLTATADEIVIQCGYQHLHTIELDEDEERAVEQAVETRLAVDALNARVRAIAEDHERERETAVMQAERRQEIIQHAIGQAPSPS